MTNTVWSGVGRPPAPPPRLLDVASAGSDRSPLFAWVGLQVERPELVHADDHGGVLRPGRHTAIGDGVQLEDPVLLRFELGIAGLLERLDHLKRHALLS